ALDDVGLVADNPLVHHPSGLWRAFAMPYWPPALGGYRLYRPFAVATYTLDWLVAAGHAWWFHAVNVAWHAGSRVAVALRACAWVRGVLTKETAAVVPGLVAAAWLLDIRRQPRRRIATYLAVWCVIAVIVGLVQEVGLRPYPGVPGTAIVFRDQSPLTVRLTAIAALGDVARL